MSDRLQLALEGSMTEVARLAEALEAFAAQHQWSPSTRTAVYLALEEIVTNVIRHGGAGKEACVTVDVALQPGELVMTVEDNAKPFDPLQAPPPDLNAPLECRPIGGLGIHLVRKLMDQVTYERLAGKNRLVMRKRL